MFERFLMYWLLWLLFILIYFFMKEERKRTVLTIWLLLVISLSSVDLEVGHLDVSVSMLLVLVGAFIYMVEQSFSLLPLLRAFIIMITYCSILIWQLVAPVWFFLSGYFMIPVLVVIIALVLNRRFENVYPYMLLGISLGQMLFDLLLHSYQLHDQIGMIHYFIHISLAVLLLISIRTCYKLWEYTSTFFQRKLSESWF